MYNTWDLFTQNVRSRPMSWLSISFMFDMVTLNNKKKKINRFKRKKVPGIEREKSIWQNLICIMVDKKTLKLWKMSFKCSHVIYTLKLRRDYFVDFKHLKNGRKINSSKKETLYINACVLLPFDALIWVTHTHPRMFKLIWWMFH